jgi:DNA topoisomerase I
LRIALAKSIWAAAKKAVNQEGAHEAIRPTYPDKAPDQVKEFLSRDQMSAYRLIWDRFMASLMAAAVMDTVTVHITRGDLVCFKVSGSKVHFAGFTALYVEGTDDADTEEEQIAT